MPSTNWTLPDDQTLAEYVRLEDFTGLLQNRIGISPDHVALLMRDGQIVDTFTGAHFAVGGVWQSMKDLFGGKHAVRLLVADLKPFQVQGEVEGITKDHLEIGATVAVEFQVNSEKPANILGLMKERMSLTKSDVYERLVPHLKDRVFGTAFRQVNADSLRGNTLLQDKVQADILLETERLFKDLGILVRAVSITWAINAQERALIERSANEREQERLDYEFARKKREMERENQALEFRFSSEVSAEKLQAASEDELRHMILRQEFSFIDAREEGVRGQELKKLGHEMELLNIQRRAGYEKALQDAQNDVDRASVRLKLTQVENQIQQVNTEQRLRLIRLEAEERLHIDKSKQDQELDFTGRARAQQMKDLRDISTMELDAREREGKINREDRLADHDMAFRLKTLESQSELDKLNAQGRMTPEQILAIQAGLSPEVAKIFTERARAEINDADKREALLREMVALTKEGRMSSEEQARFFFDKAMQGAQGVAAAGRTRLEESKEAAETTTVECPNCHRNPLSTDRFCRYCGHPMRG